MGTSDRRVYTLLTVVSAVSFVGFGVGYLTVPRMRAEFTRYGMDAYRVPAAWLQVAGGTGQAVGLLVPPVGAAASAGLAGMMLVAVGVRVDIGDPPLRMAPAVAYLALCLYVARAALRRLRPAPPPL